MNRFLLVIIGSATGVDKDLNYIADGESGVNFVDGKGMFICTFYSPYSTPEIHEKLAHRPAMMIFDITNSDTYGVNLPSKYYTGIFPEIKKELNDMAEIQKNMMSNEDSVVSNKVKKPKKQSQQEKVEEYDSIDEILDKLSRNNYDRGCLTEKELNILNKA